MTIYTHFILIINNLHFGYKLLKRSEILFVLHRVQGLFCLP